MTDTDHLRLREMIESLHSQGNPLRGYIRELKDEIEQAAVVPAKEVERGIVTMNSRVRVRDETASVREDLTLVYPDDADIFGTRLSVLTSLGVRLLGQREGDVVDWPVRRGVRKLRVEQIVYQPESSGHFHL
jgi:regulator of nucleoside diphosphate kinase